MSAHGKYSLYAGSLSQKTRTIFRSNPYKWFARSVKDGKKQLTVFACVFSCATGPTQSHAASAPLPFTHRINWEERNLDAVASGRRFVSSKITPEQPAAGHWRNLTEREQEAQIECELSQI
jgi:hypothetical protein